ncbi:LigA [Rhodotorula toruloides ATCC 204091]|uniref:BY PROTMAP: gi/342319453/gb/EGU11401.1/ LigA [Rhodotorula glutinis ATCC 204091] n=1 Tax=Rhodotorula toruloides TaxID=5286 RepID=A0A0K3CPH6_RHOTO|nr:LigA [Rhodotorula toruloides ATCC 204091]KAK4330306.1 LigA [Rhodotorula toruloides]
MPAFSLFSSTSAPSPDQETLTSLPPRLAVRHRSLPDLQRHERPLPPVPTDRRWSAVSDASSDLGGHSFAALLSRDTRRSFIVPSLHQARDPESSGVEEDRTQPGERLLAIPGADFAVAGPDVYLLLQELHRARISRAQKVRRRTAYFAGFFSLVVLVITLWYLGETSRALARYGGRGRGVLRWIELSAWLTVLCGWPLTVLFLRTRRPTLLTPVTLTSAFLSSTLHLLLAFSNLILSLIWRGDLGLRCSWGTDVAWTAGRKGAFCADDSSKGWTIAATIRLLLTILIVVVWFLLLRSYARALHTPSIISPSQIPSAELQALLDTHTATIVPLSAPFDPSHVAPLAQLDSNHLPEMPDRATHYIHASDSAWSYDPAHHRQASVGASSGSRASRAVAGVLESAGVWLGAQVWRGVGWLVVHGPQPRRPLPAAPADHDYAALFRDVSPPPSTHGDYASKRSSASSASPLLGQSTAADEVYEFLDDSPPPPPPKDAFVLERSQGLIVYVRMSDGRLVRRLSTIASESEGTATRRSRSDLTSS